MPMIDRDELRAGDTITRDFKPMRGKPVPTAYTVTGRTTYKGREYVTVRSTVQGEGSIALDTLPKQVEVAR